MIYIPLTLKRFRARRLRSKASPGAAPGARTVTTIVPVYGDFDAQARILNRLERLDRPKAQRQS
jgi:hypothetical protein